MNFNLKTVLAMALVACLLAGAAVEGKKKKGVGGGESDALVQAPCSLCASLNLRL